VNRRKGNGEGSARGPGGDSGRGKGRGDGRSGDARSGAPRGGGPRKGGPRKGGPGGGGGAGGGGKRASAERGSGMGPTAPRPPAAPTELRLQTYLARAGVASRRASEELIREGRVTVSGVVAEIGSKVNVGSDLVRVDGVLVEMQRLQWVALHKPTGYLTTRDDERGRRTVYDLLPSELHHLFHVGRLDRDSSGLLLLTNDGDAANRLLHPSFGSTKEYWADVEGEPDDEALRRLVRGVELDDGTATALSAKLLGETDTGTWRMEIVLQEGRNREVRRMLEAVGHPVHRLVRRRFGPIALGKLRRGHWRHLTEAEVRELRGQAPVAPRRPRRR
jgi:23S rRNA pseudouridine2605 synthase